MQANDFSNFARIYHVEVVHICCVFIFASMLHFFSLFCRLRDF